MKEIKEGEKLKWGYGYCWINYDRMTFTIALVPFNLLLRYVRELYFWLIIPKDLLYEKQAMSQRYSQGYNDGKKDGRKQTIKEVGRGLERGIGGLEDMIAKWVAEGYYFDKPYEHEQRKKEML